MKADRITRERLDELVRFLPRFSQPGAVFIVRWAGSEKTADGALTFPHPVYSDDVLAFFALAGQPCWADYGYRPRRAAAMLEDDALIAQATLAQMKTMLTYCVRGERFCDGLWGSLLESGRVVALLRRLAALRESEAGRTRLLTDTDTDMEMG